MGNHPLFFFMIEMYIGLPGAGKTTLLAYFAKKAVDKGQRVYTNVHLTIPGAYYIDPTKTIGIYQLEKALILLDEGEIVAESRDYKNFPKRMSNFFMLHRHYDTNIKVFAQRYSGVDNKIRNLTVRLNVVNRSLIPGFSKVTPIEYKMKIPGSGEKMGEVVEGYRMPSFMNRLVTTKYIYRRKYYEYFNSWEAPKLKPIEEYLEETGQIKKGEKI